MHLLRVEAIGFKSFANKVNIEFKPGVNGIVGPNGCGKSNITDAIKWVLGEQSTKNLRASGMSDVIFSGSEDYKKQNFAQVTLVFENASRGLNIDFNQVEITRRLYRSGESEYLINKSPSRLKDITDLILDTGLGKDSLSMISQGAISNFAQAKPEERRAIFEEAASVAKYKKRKGESLKKLDKTTTNLQRLADIIYELESQIEPLKNQAIKAKQYNDAKEKLEKIEIGVLVHEINANDIKRKIANEKKIQYSTSILEEEKELETLENRLDNIDRQYKASNATIANNQEKLLQVIETISSIEEEKKELANVKTEEKDQSYITNLKNKIDTLSLNLEAYIDNKNNFDQEKANKMTIFNSLNNKYNNLIATKNALDKEKNNLTNNYFVMKNNLDNNTNLYAGVKAILAHKNNLDGIIGIVKDLFEVEEQYALAISTAITAQLQNVVVETSNDAKHAIEFLKRNRSGKASFMPLDTIKERYMKEDDYFLASKQAGFINTAANLISYDQQYQNIFGYLLNTTLVTENIDQAIKLSKILKSKYRIVTLDGEIINVGGVITGGKNKNDKFNPLTLKHDISKIEQHIQNLEHKISKCEDEIFTNQQEQATIRNKVNQISISLAKVEEKIAHTKQLFTNYKNEYELISNETYHTDDSIKEVDEKYKKALNEKEDILLIIQSSRKESIELNQQIEILEKEIKQLRKSINTLKDNYNHENIELTKINEQLKTHLDRLASEYRLTIDRAKEESILEIDITLAKEEVTRWKKVIKSLGNVNLLAIEEYEKAKERFEFLTSQKQDLENSRNEILNMINETDKIMIAKFKQTVEEINDVLPITFKKLFGGGEARLEYSDPTNLLETGIEIIARPPGKSIQNLTLFSGGEKALIALAVLFAIMKVRPVPLCILDEVEAALDQANVERFAKFLKEFSDQTQFIVITHRPGTMEECDMLYGVTMQEKGVTKMIGVQLEEAKTMIEREN